MIIGKTSWSQIKLSQHHLTAFFWELSSSTSYLLKHSHVICALEVGRASCGEPRLLHLAQQPGHLASSHPRWLLSSLSRLGGDFLACRGWSLQFFFPRPAVQPLEIGGRTWGDRISGGFFLVTWETSWNCKNTGWFQVLFLFFTFFFLYLGRWSNVTSRFFRWV